MDYGLWTMDYGLWTMDYGLWTMDYGLWTMDYGLWTMDYGLWTMDYGLWTTSFRYFLLHQNFLHRNLQIRRHRRQKNHLPSRRHCFGHRLRFRRA
jgi:hypothetical protein